MGNHRSNRKPFSCTVDCRLQVLPKRECSEPLIQACPGCRNTGNRDRNPALFRNFCQTGLPKPVCLKQSRGRAAPIQAIQPPILPYQRKAIPSDAVGAWLHNRQAGCGCQCGVHCISALFQNIQACLRRLAALLPAPKGEELLALWEEYDAAATQEARLVKALDKAETILQHNQGQNPPDFDYDFNLDYGKAYFQGDLILEALRDALDRGTRRRMEEQQGMR